MKRKTTKKPKTIASPRVAAIQMNSTPNIRDNLAQARHLLDEALKHDPNIVAFPENMTLLTNDSALIKSSAENLHGPVVSTLREWAAEHDIWLLAGSLPIKAPGGKIYNSSIFFSPEGEIHARYDKIHLFDVDVEGDQKYLESKNVKAGTQVVSTETPWGTLGLSICYDIRFPELYRKLASQGAHCMFIPAAFTAVTGAAHWDILTRARAVENQCYVVAPGQTGSPHPGRECYGHTRIVDAWGRIVAERPAGIGVVWADLNYLDMDQIRGRLPALLHRKLK
jgi:predicted amidohydrolase